jgi:hypothetical protein
MFCLNKVPALQLSMCLSWLASILWQLILTGVSLNSCSDPLGEPIALEDPSVADVSST